jgi:osmotically-inducible protein OsmY
MTPNRKLLAAPLIGIAFSLGGIAIAVTGCTALTEKHPREALTDAEIIARAKTVFAADPVVKARNIHVTAVKGDVTLSGVVKSEEEARRAVELVRPIPGVRTVMSALKVESA